MTDLLTRVEKEQLRVEELRKKIGGTTAYMVLGGFVASTNGAWSIYNILDDVPIAATGWAGLMSLTFLGILGGAYWQRRKYKKELRQRETWLAEQQEWKELQKGL